MRRILPFILCLAALSTFAEVWQPDLGNGRYKNPIIYADYSDPDAIAVGEDYYMISSSFNSVPGLQILHSQDLVNWTIVNAALPERLPGTENLTSPQWGNCVWAPSLREHDGKFYIFYGDPDRGIYMLQTDDIRGRWSEPVLVKAGVGMIDPCPLWDEDGKVYLVHAFAGSRAGLKSVLAVCELQGEAASRRLQECEVSNRLQETETTPQFTASRIIYDGHKDNPTIEGPKFYKKDGYYYIFAPAGGVKTGWQLVLRSRLPYGPYETKVVLAQGKTDINAPHQGAWVHTVFNEDWFLHFQDVGVLGRIVHLQPMQWKDGWPIMGNHGEPVVEWKKPKTATFNIAKHSENSEYSKIPQTSDEFDSPVLGWQWQWAANPDPRWYFCDAQESLLRLYSVQYTPEANTKYTSNFPNIPNLLLQKAPAPNFTFTAKVRFCPNDKNLGEKAGLIVSGRKNSWLELYKQQEGITMSIRSDAPYNAAVTSVKNGEWVYLRMTYNNANNTCTFAWSKDNKTYKTIGLICQGFAGEWIGMKVGLFCTRTAKNNDGGWLDIDWVHIE